MSYIGPLTSGAIDSIIGELKKQENKDKINKYIIDPVLRGVRLKLTPYLLLFVLSQIIIVCLLVYVLITLRDLKITSA